MAMQAQENTYNMVIEMTNGTKITDGPNDISSLTFNNGELQRGSRQSRGVRAVLRMG